MNKKVTTSARWYGPVPTRNGRPLPKNQWARAGRRRKWIVRWYDQSGKRPQETFDTKEEADEFVRHKTAEFETRGLTARIRHRRISIRGFVDEVVELRTGPRGQRMSIGTLREYKFILTRFAAFVGDATPLDAITMADAARYLAMLRKTDSRRGRPLSVSSVNKHKRNIKAAFNIATDQLSYLSVNPFASLRHDRVANQDNRYITPAEYSALLTACSSLCRTKALWWEAFLTVCYTAGTRANEATHLLWCDIDFDTDAIRIVAKPEMSGLEAWRPKDYDARTVPVPLKTIDVLTRLHVEADEGTEFVFIPPERISWIRAKREAGTLNEGQAVINNLDRDFKRLARAADVPNASLHDLRRSAISHWARKLAAPIVQELAGHADIKTTQQYYVTIRAEDLAEARDVTARALLLDAN